jgi:hypothetical protein
VYAYINSDTAQGVPCIPSFILILLTGLIELLQFTHTYLIAESKGLESIALFLLFERAEDLLTEVPANLLPLLLTTRSQSQQYRAAQQPPIPLLLAVSSSLTSVAMPGQDFQASPIESLITKI